MDPINTADVGNPTQLHRPYLNWTPPICCRLSQIWHCSLEGSFVVDNPRILQPQALQTRQGLDKKENMNTILRTVESKQPVYVLSFLDIRRSGGMNS